MALPASVPPLPLGLRECLPHPVTPWNISQGLFDRIRAGTNEKVLSSAPNTPPEKRPYKTSEVLPTDPEYQFILQYFMYHKPTHYSIKKVYCIHNPHHTAVFEGEIKNINEETENPVFKPKWKEDDLVDQRAKTIARWTALTDPFKKIEIFCPTAHPPRTDEYLRPKVIPMWHGSSRIVCESVCRSNFTFFGKHNFFDSASGSGSGGSTDIGYFGSGIYFTNSARYAAMYSPQGILILAWVSMREPYPVVSNVPYPQKCSDMKRLEGKGHRDNYNAHYIPVTSGVPGNPLCMEYYPCMAGQEPAWDELVVFKNSQTLPRFWVELSVDFYPNSPSLLPNAEEKKAKLESDKKKFQEYMVGAKKKDAEASYQLGMCYQKGIGCSVVPKEAIKWFQKAAQLRHAKASLELGHCYAKGLAVLQDAQEAFKWYLKAAELKLADAEYQVAVSYAGGTGVSKDEKEAFKWYQKAADQGHEGARIQVTLLKPKTPPSSPISVSALALKSSAKKDPAEHFKAAGQKVAQEDYKAAAEEYQLAADQGHAEAQCKLGACYFKGQGVPKSETEAVKWYQKAVDQNFPLAQYYLGSALFNGRGIAKDVARGIELQRKAAEKGVIPAQYYMGKYHLEGNGVTKDLQEALKWFQKAADQGDADAKKQVALLSLQVVPALNPIDHFNLGVRKADQGNHAGAAKEFQIAAEQGHAGAQCRFGACYFRGLGVAKNEEEAVKWYQKAVDQNFPLAQYYLGSALYYGRGIAKDVAKGIELHRKAAEQDIIPALYYLATFHLRGEGVAKDEREALKLFLRAAALGDQDSKTQAAKLQASLAPAVPPIPLAAEQALSESIPQNANDYFRAAEEQAAQNKPYAAAALYQKAAEAGHAEAQCKYGACCFLGKGVVKNAEEAVKWYQKAVDQNFPLAQYYLGSALFNGRGIAKDVARGIELQRKAAEQGVKEAQYYMGKYHLEGNGVTKDLQEALRWFQKAADQGDFDAKAEVEKLKALNIA